MSIIKSIRSRLDHQLDHWDARLDALEAQLDDGREEAMQRVEQGRQKLSEVAHKLEENLEDVADLSAEAVADLSVDLQQLRVQLALGQAETREAFNEQRTNLRHAISGAEAKLAVIEQRAEERVGDEMERFVKASDRLQAELDAAELQFALGKAEARSALAEKRGDFNKQLRTLRKRLHEAGEKAEHRLESLEDELGEGVAAYRDSMVDFFRHI